MRRRRLYHNITILISQTRQTLLRSCFGLHVQPNLIVRISRAARARKESDPHRAICRATVRTVRTFINIQMGCTKPTDCRVRSPVLRSARVRFRKAREAQQKRTQSPSSWVLIIIILMDFIHKLLSIVIAWGRVTQEGKNTIIIRCNLSGMCCVCVEMSQFEILCNAVIIVIVRRVNVVAPADTVPSRPLRPYAIQLGARYGAGVEVCMWVCV